MSTSVVTIDTENIEIVISNAQGPQGATGPTGPQGLPGGIATVVAPITNAGTSTAAIIGLDQGAITLAQSQVTNLVSDLAAKTPATRNISTTAPLTGGGDLSANRTLGVTTATTAATGVVQLSDSTSTTSSVLASTPTATKAAFDLATTANTTANLAIPLAQKAAANGVATLDATGLVPTNQLPALAITNTFVVASQAAMVALTAQTGDVAIRTDLNKSFILTADPASTLANWQELLTPPDAVTSVDSRVGAVTLSDLYAAKTHASTHATGGTDAVTLAQSQITNLTTDLSAKAPLASPTFTGTVVLPSTTSIGTVTSAEIGFVDGVTSAIQTQIDTKVATSRSISTTAPLAGGGDLSANRTLSVATATTGATGVVQLSDTVGDTSITTAATVGSVTRADTQLIQYGAEGSVLQNIPTRVNAAEQLLKQAVWWIDSAHSGSSGQAIQNLGWGGAALNATAGSTTAADSNDPVYLGWDGINYVYTPGVTNNNLTQSSVVLPIGNKDYRALIAPDTWTPAGNGTIFFNFFQRFYVLATGALRFQWVLPDGSTFVNADSTVAITASAGAPLWVRFTITVSPTWAVTFFTSNDGITWTQLGAVRTGAVDGTSAATSGTVLGETAGSQFLTGKIYRAQILNGIDGVPVLDVDTSVIASGSATSFTALTGQTVTVNRSTSGRKTTVVTHPVWLFGTDDFMEVNNRFLERTSANFLYLPGVAGNYASSPDSAALDITGDIDLRIKVAMDDWTPSTASFLLAKTNQATQRCYMFYLRTDGKLVINWSTDGTAGTNLESVSSVATGIADGATKWIRATLDVDNGASGNTATFFTSDDGSSWTQLGTTVVTAGVTSIFAGTAALAVGTDSLGSNPARGKFFRAQVLNGIGGTVAFDANFETGITTNLPTTFTESSANAATVTINYSGTGYRSAGVIASTYVFPGNPNTFKLSAYSLLDFGAGESFTVLYVGRQWATPSNFTYLLAKTVSNIGYGIFNNGTAFQETFVASDGINVPNTNGTTYTAGSTIVLGGIRNVNTDSIAAFTNGTIQSSVTDTTTLSLTNPTTVLQINRGNGFTDAEFIAAAVFRKALNAGEIATINSYFQGRVN